MIAVCTVANRVNRAARSGSAKTARSSGRSRRRTSSSSPPTATSHARRSTVSLVRNAAYTVSTATPAATATSAIVVAP